MSVTGSSPVAYRRFNGWQDPALPEGTWLGSVTVSGDASGGTVTASLDFAEATEARLNSRMFSLEELGLSVNAVGADQDTRVATDNLGRDGPAAFQHRFELLLANLSSTDTAQLLATQLGFLPLWLGAMRVPLVRSRIFSTGVNPTVGSDWRFEAAGYWWGSRSILVDGGPKRPPNGLYRA